MNLEKILSKSNLIFAGWVVLVYAFCALLRCYWIAWAGGVDSFVFDGELMINTNDGYWFAEGVRDLIAGFHQPNDLSAVAQPLSKFTALIYTAIFSHLGVSFEALIVYVPVFFGALVVVPLMLIAKEFNNTLFGVVSSLFVCLIPSYFARTNGGYYDTDIFVLFFPLLVGYAFVRVFNKPDLVSLALVGVSAMLSTWFHPQTSSFTISGSLILLAVVFFKERKNFLLYAAVLLALTLSADVEFLVKLIFLAIVIVVAFLRPNSVFSLYGVAVLAVAALVFLVAGGTLQIIFDKLLYYAVKGDANNKLSVELSFFDVTKTISEAQKVSFLDSLRHLYHSKVIILLSCVGYLILAFKRPVVLFFLPPFVLGLISFQAGIRFAMFASVGFGLGFATLVCLLYSLATSFKQNVKTKFEFNDKMSIKEQILALNAQNEGKNNFQTTPLAALAGLVVVALVCIYEGFIGSKFGATWLRGHYDFSLFQANFPNASLPNEIVFELFVTAIFFIAIIATLAWCVVKAKQSSVVAAASFAAVVACVISFLNINLTYVYASKSPTVLTKDEMVVLDRLKDRASREDYCISWWDWGYPMRYFADVKTLTDGAKHFGWQNYAVSYILTRTPVAAANMARIDVEFNEMYFKNNSNISFDQIISMPSNLPRALDAYGVARQDANKFLNGYLLNQNLQLPPKTRDIYLYLPHRISDILATIALFSWRDLVSGESLMNQFYFYQASPQGTLTKAGKSAINLGSNIAVSVDGMEFFVGETQIKLNSFYSMKFDAANKKFERSVKQGDPNSQFYGIYLYDTGRIYIMNAPVFASTFVQMFMLGSYDTNLFELVDYTATAKLYKLKK